MDVHQRADLIEILKAQVALKTWCVTGQVSSGYVRLRGWLESFELAEISGKIQSFQLSEFGVHSAFFDEDVTERSGWWCLPMVEQEASSLEGDGECAKIFGLLLLKTGEYQYQRRGVLVVWRESFEFFRRPTYPKKQDKSIEARDGGSGVIGDG
jgi:hypothetical protein